LTESWRDIRIVVAAYEERSFTAAAVREHATQSGVSQHIRKLKEGFRVMLFSREKGQVAPTPAADAYYSRCIQILRNIEPEQCNEGVCRNFGRRICWADADHDSGYSRKLSPSQLTKYPREAMTNSLGETALRLLI
jgi:hypothetical protein